MTNRFIIDDDGIITDMSDLSMYIDNEDCCEKLNELNNENNQLKNSEVVTDQKELQKLIYQTIINLIDSDKVDTLNDLKELLQKQL